MMRPPYPYPPIILPDPEVLQKYGKIAVCLLRLAKKRATDKGREHKKTIKELFE